MGSKLLLIFLFLVALMAVQLDALRQGDKGRFAKEIHAEKKSQANWSGRRRRLGGSSYISYSALSADNTPCKTRGKSYFNCRTGARGNPR